MATVAVTGQILVNGEPVGGASVTFTPDGEGLRSAHAVTDSAGGFELTTFDKGDGAVPGDYLVAISKAQLKSGIEVKSLTPSAENKTGEGNYKKMMVGPGATGSAVEDTGTIPMK